MRKNRFSTKEAGIYLKMHPNTLSNMRSMSKGPRYVKNGHEVYYIKEDLDKYKNEQIKIITPGENK